MKKIILTGIIAMMAIGSKAQLNTSAISADKAYVTWNIRGGLAINTYNDDTDALEGAKFALQANIPFMNTDPRWVISPTLEFALYGEVIQFDLPLFMGYKVRMGRKSFFIPKAGLLIGREIGEKESNTMFGIAGELSFELKHFVIALNGSSANIGLLCLGYKF